MVKANLLPAQKVDAVREALSRHATVVIVGDGINHAPALAAATVGVALGAHGAAVSAEAADVVITVDDVGRVADAMAIGQRTLRIALQSIWVGLDVAVILNALRAR
jgi:P-type E1-E2 ATPase